MMKNVIASALTEGETALIMEKLQALNPAQWNELEAFLGAQLEAKRLHYSIEYDYDQSRTQGENLYNIYDDDCTQVGEWLHLSDVAFILSMADDFKRFKNGGVL